MLVIEGSGFVMLFENPLIWGEQYERKLNLNSLITPQDPYILELKTRFDTWLGTSPSINGTNYANYFLFFDDGIKNMEYGRRYFWQFQKINWSRMDEVQQAAIVDWYIQEYIVHWTSDTEVYNSSEYKATPHQILQQNVDNGWTQAAKDDCDGIAVVTVSLLRNYNINAYIGAGQGHWFTVIRPTNMTEMKQHYGTNEAFAINYWETVHLWCYFDAKEFYLGQNLFRTMADLFLMSSEDEFEPFIGFVEANLVVVYLLTLLVAIIGVLFIGYPRNYPNQDEQQNREARRKYIYEKKPWLANKKNPLNWIVNATYVRVGNPFRKIYRNEWLNIILAFGLLLVPIHTILGLQGHLTQYAIIILDLYIIVLVFLFDRDVFVKIKNKIRKDKKQENHQ
jgi:hypothetical protein